MKKSEARKEFNKLSKKEKEIVGDFMGVFVRHKHLGAKRLSEIIATLLPIRR